MRLNFLGLRVLRGRKHSFLPYVLVEHTVLGYPQETREECSKALQRFTNPRIDFGGHLS